MPKPKPPFPARLRRPAPARPAVVAVQRAAAERLVKPVLPPKPKARAVLRPVVRPAPFRDESTQRLVAPYHLPPVAPPRPMLRHVQRPVAKPLARATVPTQRVEAVRLVRTVQPPEVVLRNVQRPISQPLATLPVRVERMGIAASAATPVETQREMLPAVVPVITPPEPVVRMGLRTSAPVLDGDAYRMIRYATPAAEDFLAEFVDGVAAGSAHGALRLVRSQYAGARARRAARQGYGASSLLDPKPKYKITSYGWIWRYDYINPSSSDDVTVLYNGSEEVKYVYTAGSTNAENVRNSTVDAEEAWGDALARAKEIKAGGTSSTTSTSTTSTTSTQTYTLSAAEQAPSSFPTIKKGAKDSNSSGAVSWVAQRLGLVKYPNKYPEFDQTLDSLVRGFQNSRGLTVDGVVGKNTYKALGFSGTVGSGSSSSAPSSAPSTFVPSTAQTVAGQPAAGADDDKKKITEQVWFWPTVILVPTAGIIAGILLLSGPKPKAAAAAPTLAPA